MHYSLSSISVELSITVRFSQDITSCGYLAPLSIYYNFIKACKKVECARLLYTHYSTLKIFPELL